MRREGDDPIQKETASTAIQIVRSPWFSASGSLHSKAMVGARQTGVLAWHLRMSRVLPSWPTTSSQSTKPMDIRKFARRGGTPENRMDTACSARWTPQVLDKFQGYAANFVDSRSGPHSGHLES